MLEHLRRVAGCRPPSAPDEKPEEKLDGWEPDGRGLDQHDLTLEYPLVCRLPSISFDG